VNSDLILIALLDGQSYAGLLFLVSLGLTLIFGVMGILNVAHGAFLCLWRISGNNTHRRLCTNNRVGNPAIALAVSGGRYRGLGCRMRADTLNPWLRPRLAPRLGADYTAALNRYKQPEPELSIVITDSNIKLRGDIPNQIWNTERGEIRLYANQRTTKNAANDH
jgi:hypothetical protein